VVPTDDSGRICDPRTMSELPPPTGEPLPHPDPNFDISTDDRPETEELQYYERPKPALPTLSIGQTTGLVVAAVLANLAVRSGVASISSTAAAVLIARQVLKQQIRQSPVALALAAGAIVYSAWLPVRASDGLTALNAAAVASLLLAAPIAAQPMPLGWNTRTLATVIGRSWLALWFGSVLRKALSPLGTGGTQRIAPVLRGLLLAALPVVVLGGLLASADVVFAESVSLDIDSGGVFAHGFLIAFFIAALAGLVAITGERPEEPETEHRPLGAIEAFVLLVSVAGLYAIFAFVQLLSGLGQVDALLAEQNVSYAEYARSGFFQLLWAASLTLILLGLVRLLVKAGSPLVDGLVRLAGASVSLLTILIIASALVRLWLYTDEFGQTTLRWYCTAFAWMLAGVFFIVAVGHHRRFEARLPLALAVIAAASLLAVNVINPEARVAQHNLERTDAVDTLDAEYLTRLSADRVCNFPIAGIRTE